MKLTDMFKPSSFSVPHPGLYHYRFDAENEKSRVHLRLDDDGTGTLIVNANQIMHLNPTAALMAYLALEKVDEKNAVKTIQKKYRVNASQACDDLLTFRHQLSELIRPDGACPIHDLEL